MALPATSTVAEIQALLKSEESQKQRLLPVVKADGTLAGVLTRNDIRLRIEEVGEAAMKTPVGELVRAETAKVYPDESLRQVVYQMAELSLTRMPVVEHGSDKFLGLVSLNDLLTARARHLEEERRRERVLKFSFASTNTSANV
jgi:CBS domain-containing protein